MEHLPHPVESKRGHQQHRHNGRDELGIHAIENAPSFGKRPSSFALNRDADHLVALFGATSASLGAAPTIVTVFVLLALSGTGVTDLRTDPAKVRRELRATAEQRDAGRAHGRTIDAKAGTLREVGLRTTVIGAVLARPNALVTGVGTGLVLLLSHRKLLSS